MNGFSEESEFALEARRRLKSLEEKVSDLQGEISKSRKQISDLSKWLWNTSILIGILLGAVISKIGGFWELLF